jgi:hypothetical protein
LNAKSAAAVAPPGTRAAPLKLDRACLVMLGAPALVGVLATLAGDVLVPIPDVLNSFEPNSRVLLAAGVGGAVYALATVGLVLRGQPRAAQARGRRAVCGAVNGVTGVRAFEAATVKERLHTGQRGCHFQVEVAGAAIAANTRLCIDQTRWNALHRGDGLRVVRIDSVLGTQMSVASEDATAARGVSQ